MEEVRESLKDMQAEHLAADDVTVGVFQEQLIGGYPPESPESGQPAFDFAIQGAGGKTGTSCTEKNDMGASTVESHGIPRTSAANAAKALSVSGIRRCSCDRSQ
mgnify:CR=1 FL=1